MLHSSPFFSKDGINLYLLYTLEPKYDFFP
jgi:hypothetical protein